LYYQTAADFYARSIVVADDAIFEEVELPTHASADARLAETINTTIGMKYKFKTSTKNSIDLRAGYYHRDFKNAVIGEDGAFFVQLDFGKGFD